MLALALALTVLAAPPRGLPGSHSSELVTQVETRLSAWLTGGGDRKALLATPAEVEAFVVTLGASPDERKAQVAAVLEKQARKPELTTFTATQALLEFAGKRATVSFFDGASHRCEVTLFDVGTAKAPRYVLLAGPRTDAREVRELADDGKAAGSMLVFLEKSNGWTTTTLPTPPPPDCLAVLKAAAKTVYIAEQAWFAEKDTYSKSLSKVGVDVQSLGVTSAKVSVAGAAPTQTFSADLGLKGGLVRIDEKGTVTVVTPCQ